jgi:ribonuclease G
LRQTVRARLFHAVTNKTHTIVLAGAEVLNEIIINYKLREKRFAVLEKHKMMKISIHQPHDQSKVGNIYIGKVVDVKVGMNAAFIDIGDGKNGYLHRDQLPMYAQSKDSNKELQSISKFLHQGKKIIVQVKKDETDIKGPLLTAIIELSGEKMIYIPDGDYIAVTKKVDQDLRNQWHMIATKYKNNREGFIVRTEAANGNEEDWLLELKQLRKHYQEIMDQVKTAMAPAILWEKQFLIEDVLQEMLKLKAGTVIADDQVIIKTIQGKIKNELGMEWKYILHQQKQNIFSAYHLEEEIENALKRIVWLANGSYIVIDETEALVIIDVNTGKFTGHQSLQDTVFKTNILAAKEIGRQLSLRDYGGIILVDFIDMKREEYQQKVIQVLQNELKKDTKYSRIVGFTELGILQITRKKTKRSLPETLHTVCPVCNGAGKVNSSETLAFRLERELWEKPFNDHEAILIEVTENVKKFFCGEQDIHLQRIEKILNIKLIFKIIHHPCPIYYIRQFGTVEEILSKLGSY